MYMRMPVETTAIRVDGAEDTGFQPPVFGRHTADSPPPDGTRYSAANGCFRTPATACPAG